MQTERRKMKAVRRGEWMFGDEYKDLIGTGPDYKFKRNGVFLTADEARRVANGFTKKPLECDSEDEYLAILKAVADFREVALELPPDPVPEEAKEGPAPKCPAKDGECPMAAAEEAKKEERSRRPCEDLEERVLSVVKNELCIKDAVEMGSDLVKDLYCNELDLVELHMRLEEEFSIPIADEDFLSKAKTIQGIVDYLKGKGC